MSMENNKKSKLESYLRGLAQDVSLGTADNIAAGAESVFTNKPYKQALQESRDAYKQAQLDNPKSYTAGEMTGTAASFINPAAGAAKLAAKTARKAAIERIAKSGIETIGRKDGEALEASDALNLGLSGMPMKMKSSKDIPWKTGKGIKVVDDAPSYGKVKNIDDKLENAQEWV